MDPAFNRFCGRGGAVLGIMMQLLEIKSQQLKIGSLPKKIQGSWLQLQLYWNNKCAPNQCRVHFHTCRTQVDYAAATLIASYKHKTRIVLLVIEQ